MMFGGIAFYALALNFSLTAFRRLVDYQYQNHRDIWVADGKPRGGKMTRKDLSFLGSDFAASLCGISWAVKRPPWLPPGSTVAGCRAKMIQWFVISFIGFFAVVAGMVLFGLTMRSIS